MGLHDRTQKKWAKGKPIKGAIGSSTLTLYPDKPHSTGPDRLDEWQDSGLYVCQQKIDGWRIILVRQEDGFVALTRHNKTDYSFKFCDMFRSDLQELLALIPVGSQLDGEWFGYRQVDLGLPPRYYIFDVLRWGKKWIAKKPLIERLELLLNELFSKFDGESIVRIDEPEEGVSWSDYYKKQQSLGYSEGVVVKMLRGAASKMTADRRECKKGKGQFKVKYRGGHSGDVNLEHIRGESK